MLIKSKTNETSYIEIKDRITAGVRDRYIFMKTPKIKYNAEGGISIDTSALTEYENNPNLYLLSKCVVKIVEEGVDKTPKNSNISDFIKMLDEDFYDSELLKDTIQKALEVYNFLEENMND